MKRGRPILTLSFLFFLTIILISASPISSGEIEIPTHIGREDLIPKINRTLLEESLDDVIELKDNKEMQGNVSFNETILDFDIYHVKFEKGWSFFDFYREISFARESDSNGTLYLDVYGRNLDKITEFDTFMTKDQSSNWTEFSQEDIDGNELFLVVYGNGNYNVTTRQYLDLEQALLLIFIEIFILSSIIIILLIVLGLIYFNYQKMQKKSISKVDKIKKIFKKDTSDIKKKIKRWKLISLINYSIGLLALLFYALIYIDYPNGMENFIGQYFDINNNIDLILFFLINILIFIVFVFLISYMVFYYYFQLEKERYMKNSISNIKIINIKIKEQIMYERTFLLEKSIFLIVFLMVFIFLLLEILRNMLSLINNIHVCCGAIFLPIILFLLIVYFILVIFSFQSIEYKKGILRTYNAYEGGFRLQGKNKKFKREEIRSIRPIPASMYYDLLPGIQRRNGKFKLVKTGVLIEDKHGNMHRVLTSKPMEIVALMRK